MGKPVLEEDEEEKGTMKHFVVTQLNKFFISHLPIDSFKDLPATYMYYFGTVAYIATIAMFIYFTKTSYDDAINQPYISIETGGGASCTSVPIAITDDYMADNKGNWVGTTNFVYSEAEFLITFNNFKVDSTIQYEDMMNAYQTGLVQIGEYTATQNLAQNLVYWMCYIRYYDIQQPSLTNFSSVGHGSLQYIQLTGDPAEVFDLGYVQGHIISKAGYCTESAFAYFDQANGMFVTNQNYSDFISKSECSSAINPLSFGYYPSIDQNVFQLGLDVYAFATAVAVNTGVLQIYDLGVASSEFFDFTYDNVTYRTGQYFDIRYPMMNTIVCIQNVTIIPAGTTGVDNLCMYQVGQTLAIPVFNHFGTNYEFPEYCDCDTNGKTSACQTFNLLAGLLFYPSDPDTPYTSEKQILTNTGIFDLLVLVTKNGGYANLNKNAYNASFAAAAPAYGQMSSNLDTVSWRKKAFNFCTLTTLSCTLLVFNAFDALSKKVSPFKYQLNNGSCHNSISVDSVYWDKLVQNTPTALTQSYYDCYQSPESALFSALGIASGNTSLAVPIVVMAILPLLYLLLVAIRQVPPKEEYSDPEKDQAIEILSILMLRLRDGKTRGVKKGGILMKLTQELITAAKEEGGYPDSDDEDDSEEAPTTKQRRKSSKAAKVSYAQSLEDKIDSDDEEERPSVLQNSSSNNNGNARKKSDEDSSIRPSQQFRRSSAKGLRKTPADKRERGKMAVFTRQLEEPKPTIFKRKSTTAGEDGGNRRRTSSAGGSGYLTSMFGAKPSSPTGGGGAREMELATYGDDATNPLSLAHYANASSPSLPKDLQIMNSEAMGVMPVNKFSKVLTGDDIDLLVDDLIKLFGEALKEGNRNPNAIRETSAPFMQGKQLTMKLAKVVLSDLLERDDKTIFFKLSNALCMHASIDLKLEMREVGSKYSDRVAYNIGGKVLTISNLDRIM